MMLSDVVIEAEAPGDCRTTFRLCVAGNLIAEGVTAAQAHFLAREVLERIPVAEVGKTPTK